MIEEKKNDALDNKDNGTPNKSKIRILKYAIYSSYTISLLLLFSVILAIISNHKTQPFYGWIESSRIEKYGSFIAGLIIEQKVSMQVDAQNDPLNKEENTLLKKQLTKLSKRDKSLLNNAHLEARDKRFIIQHPTLSPSLQGKYLLLSDNDSAETTQFGLTLDKLFVDFIMEMKDSSLTEPLNSRPHICFFSNRSEYIKATSEKTKSFHDSLGYFSSVHNRIYLFCRKDSLESLKMLEKYDDHRDTAKKKYRGDQLKDYLSALEKEKIKYLDKLRHETLCTLRHEGTHQLAHMYGMHSQRGFEKRWLTEGIAQYFETAVPGDPRNQKKAILLKSVKQNSLFSWENLVNSDEGTFLNAGSTERQLAYSQSWLIVRFLMKNYRKSFFKFINMKKNSGILDSPTKDYDDLCSLLQVSKSELKNKLQEELLKLQ